MCGGTYPQFKPAAQRVQAAKAEVKQIWPPESVDASKNSLDAALVSGGVTKVASLPPTFASIGNKIQVNGEDFSLIVLTESEVIGFDTDGDKATSTYNEIVDIVLLP